MHIKTTFKTAQALATTAFILVPALSAHADPVKDALPEKFRQAGILKVGEVSPYIPYIWKDEATGELTGFEVDVGRAIGERLGIKWDITETKWEGLITGVGAQRYDVGGAGASDIEERRSVVTFINFQLDSMAVVVLDKNKERFPTIDSLCGESIGTLKGTENVTIAREISDDCVTKKLPPLKLNMYTSIPDADLALRSGRDAAQTVQTSQANFVIRSGEQPWTIVQDGYKPSATGFYVSANSPDLANAIQLAAKDLYQSGKLQSLMAKYGLEGSTFEPMINDMPKQ